MQVSSLNGMPSMATGGPSDLVSPAFARTSQSLPRQAEMPLSAYSMLGARPTQQWNMPDSLRYGTDSASVSPRADTQCLSKMMEFQLILDKNSEYRPLTALRPFRVTISHDDTTESIHVTVRNYYGLCAQPGQPFVGLSFEDREGNTLVARWETIRDLPVVYVRIAGKMERVSPADQGHRVERDYAPAGLERLNGTLPTAPRAQPPHALRAVSPARSPSPKGLRGRRVAQTAIAGNNSRSRSAKKSHSVSQDGYSSGDGAPASSSSRTIDHARKTEISVENIVEGGRRQQAKFESSELPLFAPPQMPAAASNSSASPLRRVDQHRRSLPGVPGGQHPFSNPHPLESPRQFYANGHGHRNAYQTPGHDSRGWFDQDATALAADGVLPTPNPTIGTNISEEDSYVAKSLMAMAFSSNGKAGAMPSTGATSDAEDVDDAAPPHRRQRLDSLGNANEIFNTTQSNIPEPSFEGDGDSHGAVGSMAAPSSKSRPVNGAKPRPLAKTKTAKTKTAKPKTAKPKTVKPKAKKSVSAGPMSPASLPASRKQSVASNLASPLAGGDEEWPDLSVMPRCQRCRLSKKGCDRMRPCGRCADAGLTADECISEDESNNRKGRYGRYMGIPYKGPPRRVRLPVVQDGADPVAPSLLPAAPIATASEAAAAIAGTAGVADKNKKRKR